MYDSEEVYFKLTERHPAPIKDRKQFNDANLTTAIQLSEKEVLKATRSFPAGSSGGPDGVRPKHILQDSWSQVFDCNNRFRQHATRRCLPSGRHDSSIWREPNCSYEEIW